MTVVENAIYVDGVRTQSPKTLEDTFEMLQERGGVAWIGLYRPDEAEVRAVAREFNLHDLAVEDAISAHQRSKLEHYSDSRFLVLRPARYIDATEKVEFGELHLFVGVNFVVSVRHAESPDLASVRSRLEHSPELLRHGAEAILYAILDQLVDEYGPVTAGLLNDIDEIEDDLFNGEPGVSRRIYELTREVIAFQRALHPLMEILQHLFERGEQGPHTDLLPHLRDVLDHALRTSGQVDAFRDILQNALMLHSTLVAQAQSEEMSRMTETSLAQTEQTKKVSSWAAILFTPTLVGGIYGMNFTNMPELHWQFGYPFALGLMFATGLALYTVFKRNSWL